MIKVIDFKGVEMSQEEYDYYQKITQDFTNDNINGKDYFHDVFEVDEDGCISMLKFSTNLEIPWLVIVFLQNLMINQRLRRIEKKMEIIK